MGEGIIKQPCHCKGGKQLSTERKSIYYDGNLCVGCHSCEIACKAEHDLPAGVNRVRISVEGPGVENGRLRMDYRRIACMHCPEPPCIDVCPTGAIKKRGDGITFIDHALCTGCRDCAQACPSGAIMFHPWNGTAEICDLCFHRLDQGLLPFCVQHCMGGALFFGTRQEFEARKNKIPVGGQ